MKRKEKKKEKNINNDLGIFPSHDMFPISGLKFMLVPTPEL